MKRPNIIKHDTSTDYYRALDKYIDYLESELENLKKLSKNVCGDFENSNDKFDAFWELQKAL